MAANAVLIMLTVLLLSAPVATALGATDAIEGSGITYHHPAGSMSLDPDDDDALVFHRVTAGGACVADYET